MFSFLNKRNISKRKIWKRYVAFKAYITKGDAEISFVQQFFDPMKGITVLTVLKVWLPQISLTTSIVIIIVLAIVKIILKLTSGGLYRAVGLWKVEGEYHSKSVHISPFNTYLSNQLGAIAEKVGAENKYEEL